MSELSLDASKREPFPVIGPEALAVGNFLGSGVGCPNDARDTGGFESFLGSGVRSIDLGRGFPYLPALEASNDLDRFCACGNFLESGVGRSNDRSRGFESFLGSGVRSIDLGRGFGFPYLPAFEGSNDLDRVVGGLDGD
jgi:hypothetical protein